MCRSCYGLCSRCQKRAHQNKVWLVLTGGLYIGAMMVREVLPKKHSGPCARA